MIKIRILSLGTLKEPYWKQAEAEYLKRLKAYAKIEITELKEEPFSDTKNRERTLEKEAEKILHAIPKDAHIIALDERGKELSSPELSTLLFQTIPQGTEIVFVIGGPLGLHEIIKKKARVMLSFSHCTFTHQMMRVFLLEQLYRAGTIANGKQYHY